MYFDFEDRRPETPRVARAVSARVVVFVSVLLHWAALEILVVSPMVFRSESETADVVPSSDLPRPVLTFVEAAPLRDVPGVPDRPAYASHRDRRASSPEAAPLADGNQPRMRGNSPEMVVDAPRGSPPVAQPADATPAPAMPTATAVLPNPLPPPEDLPPPPPKPPLDIFRNVEQYARPELFDNPRAEDVDQSADIQFDTKGVDFGWWLLRFKHQVERNWIIPRALTMFTGRVVIRFVVLRNGTLINIEVLEAASVPSFTAAAVAALKLSNPTVALPAEYPDDRMPIVATFRYLADPRSFR